MPFVNRRAFILYDENEKTRDAEVNVEFLIPVMPLAKAVKEEHGGIKLGEEQCAECLKVVLGEKNKAWKMNEALSEDWITTNVKRVRNAFASIRTVDRRPKLPAWAANTDYP